MSDNNYDNSEYDNPSKKPTENIGDIETLNEQSDAVQEQAAEVEETTDAVNQRIDTEESDSDGGLSDLIGQTEAEADTTPQRDPETDRIKKQADTTARNWYVIHTYAGYENAVIRNLKQRAESLSMTHKIFDAIVPTEKTIKIKNGKRVEEDERVFPGYVLVDMIVDDQSWYVVRNTPRVTGFVGTGVNPVPVTDGEMLAVVNRMKADDTKHEVLFAGGEAVIVTDGPFKDTEGKVLSFDPITGKVKVSVAMFGRDTEVELDSLQVKSI